MPHLIREPLWTSDPSPWWHTPVPGSSGGHAEYATRLARHRAALEAGADPAVVAGWIKDIQAAKAEAETRLAGPPRTAQLDRDKQLTTALALPYQAQREAEMHIARGGPATRRRAGGHPAAMTLAEKTLVTIMR